MAGRAAAARLRADALREFLDTRETGQGALTPEECRTVFLRASRWLAGVDGATAVTRAGGEARPGIGTRGVGY